MIDIEKMEAAALAAKNALSHDIEYEQFDEIVTPSAVLELIERLKTAESELSACRVEHGGVRDSYLNYKMKFEAAEKEAVKYQELIYTIGRKFPNETRHETALRYIRQAEASSHSNATMKESEK